MSLRLLHNHSRGDSAIHRLPAALKLAGALALVLTTVLLPRTQIAALLAVAAVLILIAAASRLPAWFLLKRLLLLEPLVIGVAVLMLFQPGGGRVFAVVLLKTNLCLLATVLLSNTTPFTEMLRVLKRLRVPARGARAHFARRVVHHFIDPDRASSGLLRRFSCAQYLMWSEPCPVK